MDIVLRALVLYAFLMLVFRISGKRSLGQITSFDFVLLLVIGEATQQALIGQDYSLIGAIIAISTLVGIDIALSLIKQGSRRIERSLEDVPLVVLEHGKPLYERMAQERIDVEDVLAAARSTHGLQRLDQIQYAVLERNGGISIIPAPAKPGTDAS